MIVQTCKDVAKKEVKNEFPDAEFREDGNSLLITITDKKDLQVADILKVISKINGGENVIWLER